MAGSAATVGPAGEPLPALLPGAPLLAGYGTLPAELVRQGTGQRNEREIKK